MVVFKVYNGLTEYFGTDDPVLDPNQIFNFIF